MRRAVCPGSFDPVTNGHVDVIPRAAGLYDELVVAVLVNQGKAGLFAVEERMELLREAVADLPNVSVDSFQGLLVDYCRAHDIPVIVKGLRAVSDFEYELQMAQMNRELAGVETLFVPTAPQVGHLSSSLVKQIATFGGDVSRLVPKARQRPAARATGRDGAVRHDRGRLPAVRDRRRADQVIENARSVPMSGSCMVPRDHLLDLLDDLRESLPEEVQQAGAIVEQRTEILQQAQAEAERLTGRTRSESEQVVGPARRQREELIGTARRQRDELLAQAQAEADELLAEAEAEAERLVAEARRQREQLLADAQAQQAELVAAGQAEHERLVTETEVYRGAVARADELGAQTAAEVARMRAEVDEYVDTRLADFGTTLEHMLRSVEKARDQPARTLTRPARARAAATRRSGRLDSSGPVAGAPPPGVPRRPSPTADHEYRHACCTSPPPPTAPRPRTPGAPPPTPGGSTCASWAAAPVRCRSWTRRCPPRPAGGSS